MEFDRILRGRVVLPHELIEGEVAIKDGKIALISKERGRFFAKEVLDFEQCYIFPGMIDNHVHCFSNPEEGFTTASASAAVGGITTFFDMPYDLPHPVFNIRRFKEKVERLEREAVVDIALWATISKTGGTDQIVPLAEAGAIAFKMSTFETDPYRFPRIPDPEILRAMTEIRKTGLRAAFHAENDDIIFSLIDEFKKLGKVYPRAHMETRPPVTETGAVLKLLEFAYWTNVKLHIVHVSHPRTIDLIEIFKGQGVDVTSETCYPYLLMDVKDLDKFGPKAKMNPPLRLPEESQGLWEKVMEHKIDMVSSDHSPWGWDKKEIGKENIFAASAGLSGVEIMVPLLFDGTVAKGKMSPVDFAHLTAQHPAEVFQVPNKGKIIAGYDADFTVIDPSASMVVDETKFRSFAKWTPFHGWKLQGKIVQTIIRGQTVYDGKDVTVEPGFGRFVAGSAAKR